MVNIKSKLLCSLFGMFIFVSCKKDKEPKSSGTASAEVNGITWAPNRVSASINYGGQYADTIIALGFQILKQNEFKDYYPIEGLNITMLKNANKQILGTYLVYPYGSFSTYIEQGESSNERFGSIVSDTANNWVQITEHSSNYSHIKGNFSLTLIKIDTGIDPNRYPDTLIIRNGVFDVDVN